MKRRDFICLTTAAMAGVQLPLHLTLARSAIAATNNDRPRRALFVFTPHGGGPSYDRPNLWHPSLSNGQLVMNELSAPMNSVKQHVLFIDGMSMYGNPHGISDGHKQGNRKAMTGNGPNSLDIVIGDHFRSQTPFGSLQMGVMPNRFDHHDTPSYRNGQQVPFLDNARDIYTRLFGQGTSSIGNPDVNILSNATAELTRLRTLLGQLERERLEEHADNLAQLEKRLNTLPAASCTNPSISMTGIPNSANDESAIDGIARVMREICCQALACDLTRSVHFLFGHEANGIRLPGYRAYDHDASHNDTSGEWLGYRKYWATQLVSFITNLANTTDGSGNLLDNTLMMHYSEIGHSNSHDFNRVPFFLAGGKNFGLKTNQKITYTNNISRYDPNGQPHTRLLATIGQKMGLNMDKFGDGDGVLGNLNELFT